MTCIYEEVFQETRAADGARSLLVAPFPADRRSAGESGHPNLWNGFSNLRKLVAFSSPHIVKIHPLSLGRSPRPDILQSAQSKPCAAPSSTPECTAAIKEAFRTSERQQCQRKHTKNRFHNPNVLVRVKLQSIPPRTLIVPLTAWPRCCSMLGRHGTSWKPSPSSIRA